MRDANPLQSRVVATHPLRRGSLRGSRPPHFPSRIRSADLRKRATFHVVVNNLARAVRDAVDDATVTALHISGSDCQNCHLRRCVHVRVFAHTFQAVCHAFGDATGTSSTSTFPGSAAICPPAQTPRVGGMREQPSTPSARPTRGLRLCVPRTGRRVRRKLLGERRRAAWKRERGRNISRRRGQCSFTFTPSSRCRYDVRRPRRSGGPGCAHRERTCPCVGRRGSRRRA
jgi:hypothetical protein